MNTEAPGGLPRHLIVSYAMLLLMLVLAALDQTIVSTALPSIARDLHGAARMSWVFSAYLIASTVAVPVYGKLADRYGTRPVLLVAMALFIAGSALCGLSREMNELIVARGLQGSGGGGLLTLSMMSVVRAFPPALRPKLQGMLGAAYGLSTMAGPLAGGFLVEHFSWRWAFFINLPAGLLALGVLAWKFPRQKQAHAVAMDYLGAALLSAALVSLLLSTHRDEAAATGFPTTTLVLLGAGLVALFVWVQARSANPLLPLSLFADREFSAAVALSATSGMALFTAVVFMPLYFQTARGLSPADSGWHLMPLMAGMTLASIGCGRLLSASGRVRRLAVAGCALSCAAFAALALVVLHGGVSLWLVSACLFPLGMGIGAQFPLVTVVAQRSAAPHLLGIATASPVMFRSVAGAVGVSVLGTVFAQGVASYLGAHAGAGAPGHGAMGEAAFAAGLGTVLWLAGAVAVVSACVASFMPRRLARPAPVAVASASPVPVTASAATR